MTANKTRYHTKELDYPFPYSCSILTSICFG